MGSDSSCEEIPRISRQFHDIRFGSHSIASASILEMENQTTLCSTLRSKSFDMTVENATYVKYLDFVLNAGEVSRYSGMLDGEPSHRCLT